MCRLIETIKVLNRQLYNVEFHQLRFNSSGKALFGNKPADLKSLITIPKNIDDGLYKCRLVYSDKIHSLEFIKYEKKSIRTLKIVKTDSLEYSHKFYDREAINELYNRKCDCDDILIVKNGKLTDSSFCNIALSDGNCWYTPAMPLLAGTKRAKLIKENTILSKGIKLSDLRNFHELCLFNSMIDFGEAVLPVEKIKD